MTPPDDVDLVVAFIIEYPAGPELQKRQVIARVDPDGLASVEGAQDLDDTWTITNFIKRGQFDPWTQTGEVINWPYPFPPLACCPNLPNPNEAYGISDLTPDLIELNNVLNFVASNVSKILKFYAHPKTVATGVNASQISMGVDDVLCLPSPDRKLQILEMHSDLASSLRFMETLRADADEQSRVPAVALGRQSELLKGQLSGVAIQLMFQPAVKKRLLKQAPLMDVWCGESLRDLLVLGGFVPIEQYQDTQVELHWPAMLPTVDDSQAAQTAVLLQQLGSRNKRSYLASVTTPPSKQKIAAQPTPVTVTPPTVAKPATARTTDTSSAPQMPPLLRTNHQATVAIIGQ